MSLVVAPDDTIYIGINQGHDNDVGFLVVAMNPHSGECRQFQAPAGCVAPWGMCAVPGGGVLVTSINGQICRLEPGASTLRVVANAHTWLWQIERGPDGLYYLGSQPGAKLFRFDLQAGELEEAGSVSTSQSMLRHLCAGPDGFIYGIVGCTATQAIAFELATGTVSELLPEHEATENFHKIGWDPDDEVYVECTTGHIYHLRNGRAVRSDQEKWKGFAPLRLCDGRPVRTLDPDSVQIGEGDNARVLPILYEGAGTSIFHLAKGPRHSVYGSTLLPLYLFRYDAQREVLASLGRGSRDNGEAYSFGHVGDKLYYATYPSGLLMCYDPARDWNPAPQWDGNPRQVAELGEGHCRPRAMEVDAQERVWVGSHAEYGKFHGGLACYDTRTETLQNNPVVIPHQSIMSLASRPDGKVLYGATSTLRGSGVEPSTKEAHIFAWDVENRKMLWQNVPVPDETAVTNLLQQDGKLYGTTVPRGTFFVADARTGKVEKEYSAAFGAAREESMNWAPDGAIYGITWMALFRWQPGSAPEELLRHVDDETARRYGGSVFHRGAAIVANRLYFSSGSRLLSIQLP